MTNRNGEQELQPSGAQSPFDLTPSRSHSHKLNTSPIIMGAILLLGIGAVSGYLSVNTRDKTAAPNTYQLAQTFLTPTSFTVTPIRVIETSYPLESTQLTSPNGTYKIAEETTGDYTKITLKDSRNKVIVDDIVSLNGTKVGYNTKFGCMCTTNFKGW